MDRIPLPFEFAKGTMVGTDHLFFGNGLVRGLPCQDYAILHPMPPTDSVASFVMAAADLQSLRRGMDPR